MKQELSLFKQSKNYFNSLGAGTTFTGTEYMNHMRQYEFPTYWKGIGTSGKFDPYTSRTYRSLLHSAGFLKKIKHNLWQVLYEIPDFISVTDLEVFRGYKEVWVWNDKTQNTKLRNRKNQHNPVPASHPELYGKAPKQPTDPIDDFMNHVLDTLENIPTTEEIESNLKPRAIQEKIEKFDNEISEFIETGTYLLNKVIDSQKATKPKGEPINVLHGESKLKNTPYYVGFHAKPSDLVYYIEFNKVCSSLVHEIKMVWSKGEQSVLYKTSHGEYPAERIFLTKQELINSL